MRPIASKRLRNLSRIGLLGLLCGLPLACESASTSVSPQDVLKKSGCDPNKVVETEGYRRLALVIGVGEYKNRKVPDL